MARHYFSDVDPIGRRVSLDDGTTWITIVGLVNDVRQYGLALSSRADELYQPFARTGPLSATLLLRHGRAIPRRSRSASRRSSAQIDPRQPVSRVQTLEAIRGRSLTPPRLTAMLVTLFAVVALVLTAAGIAGVVSFSVDRRTAEIGVRMALGAPRRGVTAMIVREGLTPVAVGLAGGLIAALAMTRVVASAALRRSSRPIRSPTLRSLAVLAAAASIACLVPARRAAAVDPMSALRADYRRGRLAGAACRGRPSGRPGKMS